MTLQNKKLVFYIEEGYRDLELWYSKMRFEEECITCILVGSGSVNTYKGKLGITASVDISAQKVIPSEFDGFIFAGGFAPIRLVLCCKISILNSLEGGQNNV